MTIVAWAVDAQNSTILMDNDRPAYLRLGSEVLARLEKSTAHLYPDKIITDIHLPNVVIDIHALVAFGLIKDLANHHYQFNGKAYTLCDYRHLVGSVTPSLAHALSHAIQLIRWRDDHRFCSRCGTPTFVHPKEYASICPTCHHRNYPRIQPCVITAITRICPTTAKPQILLALHRRHANNGMHGLIAGFVEIGESLETAVVRETFEETGLSVGNIRYISSQPWPYPTNLMVGFVATHTAGEIVADTNELVYAQFFDLDNLPKIPQQGTIAHTLIQHVQHNASNLC